MGLDLALAMDKWMDIKPALLTTRLVMDRCYYLFDQIRNLDVQTLPDGEVVLYLEERGVLERTHDYRGDRLTYVNAGVFRDVDGAECSEWNIAILEMLRALPIETPIYLLWG
jgi:hypothetical protein